MKKLLLGCIIVLIAFINCNHQDHKADVVVIIENGISRSFGKLKISWNAEVINQWDEGNVFVVRDTVGTDLSKFAVKGGAAYIVKKGRKLKFLTDVDLNRSDEELAAMFLKE
jgi:hypothetical protein